MPVRTYDAKKVAVIVGGIPMSGFADGEFISVERDDDAFTKVSGSDGIVSRAKTNNRSGMATLTLAQTSPSNDVLSGFAIADELDNSGVVPMVIKDLLGNSTFFSGTAWIRKVPTAGFGKEISNREWIFDLAEIDIFIGGN